MDERWFFNLVKDYFGYKCQMCFCQSTPLQLDGILYQSFCFKCAIDNTKGTFNAWLETGAEGIITRFLGKEISTDSDAESIRKGLQILDDYCRLRLPDKFLERYDRIYELNSPGSYFTRREFW